MNEKEKALSEIIGNMTPEQLQRGAEIYDMLVQAMKDDETYRAMSNEELAKELLNVWGEIPVFSKHSNLLDEIIMRLGGVRGEQFCPNCEAETPCTHEAELYVCDICGEDFAKYIVSRNCNVSDVSMTRDVSTDIKTPSSIENTNPDYYNPDYQSPWISITSGRLPEKFQECIVLDKRRHVHNWIHDDALLPLFAQYTHWMPLPEPPEGERC